MGEIDRVWTALRAWVRAAVTRTVTAACTTVHEALRPAPVATGFAADLFRIRDKLLAENALLRQQLIVARRKVKQPKFRPFERGVMDRTGHSSSIMLNRYYRKEQWEYGDLTPIVEAIPELGDE